MRVLIDTTYVMMHRLHKSLSIYIFRLLDAIPPSDRSNFKLLVLEETLEYFQAHYPEFELQSYHPYSRDVSNRLIKYVRRSLLYRRAVNASGCDILLVPNDLIMFTAVGTKLKKIQVIHDMKSISNQPKWSVARITSMLYYGLLIRGADRIVCISNYTKQDLKRYFPWTKAQKLEVVYNSVVIPSKLSGHIPPELEDKKYILFVNTLKPYKNAMTLIHAFPKVRGWQDYVLVFVGKDTDYWQSMKAYAEKHHFSDRLYRYGNLSDDALYSLYRRAALFVTTSLKEGFGYTPIEAAMSHCPVVSTTCEALSDTTQGLLNYYEPPTDENALATAISKVLCHPPTKEELAEIAAQLQSSYAPSHQVSGFSRLIGKMDNNSAY